MSISLKIPLTLLLLSKWKPERREGKGERRRKPSRWLIN